MRLEFILSISLILNIIFISLAGFIVHRRGGLAYIQAWLTMAQPIDYVYENRVDLFRNLDGHEGDIYFIGSSATSFAEWSELINPNFKNRSISGETTARMQSRIDTVTKGTPRKLFLMIGINDLLRGIPTKEIVANYEHTLSELTKSLPQSVIYLLSVLPVHEQMYRRYFTLQRSGPIPRLNDVEILNDTLKGLTKKYPGTRYIDLTSLTRNGELREECTIDGIHLDGKGLLELATILKQHSE